MVINSLLRVAYFKIAQTSLVFGVLINSNPGEEKLKVSLGKFSVCVFKGAKEKVK